MNSRLQKRLNQVWRRRHCKSCGNTFTTHEVTDCANGLVLRDAAGKLQPFVRDKLFLSIYTSCAHRPNALRDATALSDTIISRLRDYHTQGVINWQDVVQSASEVLKRFDNAAYVHYRAFHPLPR